MLKQFVQQGRLSACLPERGRSQSGGHAQAGSERRPEAYPLGYVEGLNDARTKLADCFSILLLQ